MNGGYLPTGVATTMEQAAERSGGTFALARPAETVSRSRPVGVPAEHPAFATVTDERIARVGVAELPGGRVLGPHRAVITGSGELVHEISRYFGTRVPREHPLFMKPFPQKPEDVAGRLGVLATRGDSNYYHFLVDGLTRIGVLEQCPKVAPPDLWYVPSGASFQRDLLEMFGIAPERILDSSSHPHVRAECLVVPGLPATEVINPPWAIQYLRRQLLPKQPPERVGPIYVSRGPSVNNRSVENETEVFAMLQDRGFTYVDPGKLSVAEQIATFAGATTIVGPHGAGLTNIMFASPGTRVIEMFPDGAVLPDCYWRMACAVPGVDYRYLAGPAESTRGGLGATLVRDMVVDLAELRTLLDT
jgi:capsular polysaccharide biosynthesis protein